MTVYHFFFSPTGGTFRAGQGVACALGNTVLVDLTGPKLPVLPTLSPGDLAVLSAPAFAGRVPALAAQRFLGLQGGGAPAVVVCAYGNRAFDDTLLELSHLASAAGFCPVAGVAAVTQHSVLPQFATGRPNGGDLNQLSVFANTILQKLRSGNTTPPALPGNTPYRPLPTGVTVPALLGVCNHCGQCAARCPVGAINPANPAQMQGNTCIGCMRCVAICPAGARQINPDRLQALTRALAPAMATQKQNQLFL